MGCLRIPPIVVTMPTCENEGSLGLYSAPTSLYCEVVDMTENPNRQERRDLDIPDPRESEGEFGEEYDND
jgi:hypothetical protein